MARVCFDIFDLVKQAVDRVAFAAGKRGVTVAMAVDPALPPDLVGDQESLRRELGRLLRSAIERAADTELCLQAYLAIETDAYIMLQVFVSNADTAVPAVVAAGEASGIMFRFQRADRRQPALRRPPPAPPLRGLITEDDPVSSTVLAGMLRKAGWEVDCVTSGGEALAALAVANYDLMLLDCQLPGVDGYETARRIRAAAGAEHASSYPRPVIVAITANDGPGERQRCLDAGMHEYLRKPVSWSSLRPLIQPIDIDPALRPESEPEAAPDRAAFDRQSLLNRLTGDRSLAARIINAFVTDLPTRLAGLRVACREQDLDALRAEVHRVTGAAATAGATAIRQLAHTTRHEATQGRWPQASGCISRMENELAAFRRAWDAHRPDQPVAAAQTARRGYAVQTAALLPNATSRSAATWEPNP